MELLIISLGLIIGSISFSGSVIAWGKLNGSFKDVSFKGQHLFNLSIYGNEYFQNQAFRDVTGFRLRPATLPHDLRQVTTGLVPELQRRGLFRKRYTGSTLREHLGLARPPVGAGAGAAASAHA